VDVLRWKMSNEANVVPVAYCMYQHEYEGRCLKGREPLRLLFFGEGAKELQRMSDDFMKKQREAFIEDIVRSAVDLVQHTNTEGE
jgi:hypothetical protein